MADFSPMMKQYFQIKEEYPNCLVFFRLGDFYEMFFEDAKTASRELELTLTGRECGQTERAPMCGVPFHSAENYIARLIEKGYKVAICEQVESPSASKGIVKREVVRVITPGTVLENSMLDETKNNYICSLYYNENVAGIVFADISTGELKATEFKAKKITDLYNLIISELSRFMPREILISPEVLDFKELPNFIKDKFECNLECMTDDVYNEVTANELIRKQFDSEIIDRVGLDEYSHIKLSLSALLTYLKDTQKNDVQRLNEIDIYIDDRHMMLDINARRNLEICETMRNKSKKGSLLWVLDNTKTAMGKRLIRNWIEKPLINPAKITQRQDAIEQLVDNPMVSDELSDLLSGIFDLERIITRVVYGSANARELRSLHTALCKLPDIKNKLSEVNSDLLNKINEQIDTLDDINELIDSSIVDEPPFSIREGGMIRDGYDTELDEIRADMKGGTGILAKIEADEKEKTGITKLKISYNRVFGYYIEVSNSFKDKVPENYIRKQTLANCERYITDELKVIENRILGASERAVALEGKIFEDIRAKVSDRQIRIQTTAKAVAKLDVLNSLAGVAYKNEYTRPTVNMSGKIYIKDGRHPVVEMILKDSSFVPNDTDMDMNDNRISVITGPNMAGKSTFMRQIAIIVLMAQTGSFVPASIAEIGIVDRIFTRVGASDDLAAGQSTFMTEMSEVADVLKHATKNSLVILDEIGRGTSTFDGMSIARSVLEYIQDKKYIGAKTLFATHYHELTDMEELLSGVKNFNIAVKKRGDDITFLRRIVRGGCDDSYGIQVAKLAGVPDKVVNRAKEILVSIEEGKEIRVKNESVNSDEPVQFTLDTPNNAVIAKLKKIDVNTLTPIECMNVLFEITAMMD